MRQQATWRAWVFVLSLLIAARTVSANGYKILGMRSTRATGMGEAFITQADDASAIALNPAGLAQLRGYQVKFEACVANAFSEHTAADGTTTDIEDRWQTVPALYATSDLGRENMALGFGVSFPNGISSEWARDSFARYVATYSQLTITDISPALGLRLGERLMLGAGVNVYYADAKLRKMVDLGTLTAGTPSGLDAEGTLEGDGTAVGGNLGLIYRVNDRHSLALTYRLPYEIDIEGEYTLAAAGLQTDVAASIEFPTVVVIGYAFRPVEKWKIEFNADWTQWDEVGDITIDFSSPAVTDSMMQQGLENTMAYKLGTEYAQSESVVWRCGYIYNENATPDATWRPSLPDTDIHFLTAGIGYTVGKLTIDAALQAIYYEKRTVDNNVDLNETLSTSSVDGTYRTWGPAVSVAAGYSF